MTTTLKFRLKAAEVFDRDCPFFTAISEGEESGENSVTIDAAWSGYHYCTLVMSDHMVERIADIVRLNPDADYIRISR